MYMSIECSDCYFNGINKELKKATITERKKVLGLIKKYRKQTVYNSVPNKILIKIVSLLGLVFTVDKFLLLLQQKKLMSTSLFSKTVDYFRILKNNDKIELMEND